MRTAVASFVTTLMFVGLVSTQAAAQDRDDRGPVPAPGMIGIGGSIGAGTPSDPSFTNGVALTGNVEGYLTHHFSIRGQVSGSFWDITGRGFNGTAQPVAFDGNAVYNFKTGRIDPYVTGGLGLYRYRFNENRASAANQFGVDFGGGLEYFVMRHTSATAELLYHDVSEPVPSTLTTFNQAHYWTVTFGLKAYLGR